MDIFIHVGQADIIGGEKGSTTHCPIALAATRRLIETDLMCQETEVVRVDGLGRITIHRSNDKYFEDKQLWMLDPMERDAERFINTYDSNIEVEPQEFLYTVKK